MERRGFFGTLVALLTLGFLPRAKAKPLGGEWRNYTGSMLELPGVGSIAVLKRCGYTAAVTIDWINTVSSYAQLRQFIMVEEQFAPSQNTSFGVPDLDVNHCRRAAAVASILDLIGKNFRDIAGQDAKAEDWILVQLEGWWLHETPVPIVPGQHSIKATFIDCTYAFVPKRIAELPYPYRGDISPELHKEIAELNEKGKLLLGKKN
jgi:hypothetical protein